MRAKRPRASLLSTLVVVWGLGALFVTTVLMPVNLAHAATGCKSAAYRCVIDGYNATSMNSNWAFKYYGSSTKGGIGTPPHNCTLYAAWMLAHNGLADPGHSWGYADQWGQSLGAVTTSTPAVGSIAWYAGGAMGHVAYVARINWTNGTVYLVADNYNGGSGGFTSSGWVPFSQPSGYIHIRDVATTTPQRLLRHI